MNAVQVYFLEIAQEYHQILEKLSSSWYSQDKLEKAFIACRDGAIFQLQSYHRPQPTIEKDRSVGLNSVGLLLDRLTILSIKTWRLNQQENNDSDAMQICREHILDITGALSEAVPTKHPLNSKITIHCPSVEANIWEAAIYDLMTTNLLIWKAQEPLYCESSIEAARQFQMYVSLFPQINLRRDALIHGCDRLYWLCCNKLSEIE